MRRVYLDFETRSELNIWDTGAWVYSAHPSTQILCAAFAVDNSDVYMDDWDKLTELSAAEDTVFYAHNAFFERCIWKHVLRRKLPEIKEIPLIRWRDTMAKTNAFGLPASLGKCAEALNLTDQKDKRGRQIMLRLSKPSEGINGSFSYDNSPSKFAALREYCRQDVIVERAIDRLIPDLSATEQQIWFYDQLINSRGVSVDRESVVAAMSVICRKTDELSTELVGVTSGRITRGTEVKGMLAFLNDTGSDIPNLQKQTVAQYIASGKLSDTQMKVLRLRQQLGRMSVSKYQTLLSAIDQNNILRDCYMYHSAGTGRWGGKLVQLQNLTYDKTGDVVASDVLRDIRSYKDSPVLDMMYPTNLIDAITLSIRGVFVPSAGKELYVVDYSAIEPRVLFWVSDETSGLTEFMDTGSADIYVKMARRVYKNPGITKTANPKERAVGKALILGAGYGMSADKFKLTCADYGINISEFESAEAIKTYRSTYAKVRKFWADTESNMFTAVFNTPDKPVRQNKISWLYDKKSDRLFCYLPSKRVMVYTSPKLVDNRFGSKSLSYMTVIKNQWARQEIYGALVTENIVQAIARDIMAYSFPGLEESGFPVLMHTHDEIVSERYIGENRIQEMTDIMCETVTPLKNWAKGCPITADGFVCQSYRKQ